MQVNQRTDDHVLPYLESELQPKTVPSWAVAIFIAFVLGALLFPFYA